MQAAEKVRQRRSRVVQILNVPQRVRLRSSLAAALLDGLFEQPARVCRARCIFSQHTLRRVQGRGFFPSLVERGDPA